MKPKQRKAKWLISFFDSVPPSRKMMMRNFVFSGTLESALAQADQLECEVEFAVKKLVIVRLRA